MSHSPQSLFPFVFAFKLTSERIRSVPNGDLLRLIAPRTDTFRLRKTNNTNLLKKYYIYSRSKKFNSKIKIIQPLLNQCSLNRYSSWATGVSPPIFALQDPEGRRINNKHRFLLVQGDNKTTFCNLIEGINILIRGGSSGPRMSNARTPKPRQSFASFGRRDAKPTPTTETRLGIDWHVLDTKFFSTIISAAEVAAFHAVFVSAMFVQI